MFNTKIISLAIFTLGLSAPSFGAGLHQILGPYTASMSQVAFESSGLDPFHVVIDQHEVFGCRIDKYYRQSVLNDELFYVEIHDDPRGNDDCTSPKNIVAGSVIKVNPEPTSSKTTRKTLLINSYSATPSDSVQFEFDSIKVTTNDTKDFWFYRIYDSLGTAFTAKISVSNTVDTGECVLNAYNTYPLDFSFYQEGELIESDSRIITRNDSGSTVLSSGTSCPGHSEMVMSWDNSPDPHPFRNIVIYVEKTPGVTQKPKITVY